MKKLLISLFCLSVLVACTEAEPSNRTAKGNANASIVVTEYFDLQCPACKAAHSQIALPMIEQYGDSIRYEAMHFPLRQIHRFALDAAMAAECAADQGKFWEYIDIAFENQENMDKESILQWGTDVELNTEQFSQCVRSEQKKGTVLADYKKGVDLGIRGTPTFFINGEQIPTNELFNTLDTMLGTNMPL